MVTNPSGIFSVPMAEHTMGLLLALARNFPDSVREQDRARWAQQQIWDKPPAFDGAEWESAVDCGVRLDRSRSSEASEAFEMPRVGRDAIR